MIFIVFFCNLVVLLRAVLPETHQDLWIVLACNASVQRSDHSKSWQMTKRGIGPEFSSVTQERWASTKPRMKKEVGVVVPAIYDPRLQFVAVNAETRGRAQSSVQKQTRERHFQSSPSAEVLSQRSRADLKLKSSEPKARAKNQTRTKRCGSTNEATFSNSLHSMDFN